MAGMPAMSVDTTVTFPALGSVCVAAIAFHSVGVVARPKPADGAEGGDPAHGFALGSVEACRVVVALVPAYAILRKPV